MRNLLLLTPKVLESTNVQEWIDSVGTDAVLFTGANDVQREQQIRMQYSKAFPTMLFFRNYEQNDLVEKEAINLHRERPFQNVVSLSEVDVLRSARIRERCGLPGQTEHEAWYFRDKFLMKRRAHERGVATPKSALVRHAFDLIDFVAAHRYPVIVRPTSGRGSANTVVIQNDHELDTYLSSGQIAATDFMPQLFVETFINGPMVRADGIALNGVPTLTFVAQYINSTLDFMNGMPVASYSLAANNPLRSKAEKSVQHLLNLALPGKSPMLFHAQYLVDEAGELVLCEVASRLGGGAINDEVLASTGVNIKMQFVAHQCGTLNLHNERYPPQERYSARVLIPPQKARLDYLPNKCPYPWVFAYTSYGVLGKTYNGPAMTNSEIASLVLVGNSEREIIQRVSEATEWFNSAACWSN